MSQDEKGWFIFLDVVFIAIAFVAGDLGNLPDLESPFAVLAVLGLASFRLGRAVSFNMIFLWLRQAVDIVEAPDSSGQGANNQATGVGLKYVLGELVSCPICSGTWAAMILLGLYLITPQVGQVLVYALAAAGLAEFTHWMSEAGQWLGRWGRESAGAASRVGGASMVGIDTKGLEVRKNGQ